jgi:hypothetical protein
LPRSDKPSPGFFFDNFPVVLFVELHIYNTVVLGNLQGSRYSYTTVGLPDPSSRVRHSTVQ